MSKKINVDSFEDFCFVGRVPVMGLSINNCQIPTGVSPWESTSL